MNISHPRFGVTYSLAIRPQSTNSYRVTNICINHENIVKLSIMWIMQNVVIIYSDFIRRR